MQEGLDIVEASKIYGTSFWMFVSLGGIMLSGLVTTVIVLWNSYDKQIKINQGQAEKIIEVTAGLTNLVDGISKVSDKIPEDTAQLIVPKLDAIKSINNDIKNIVSR